jgi:DMSO/TMAO reductase YedYZ molybdopterin-dependent catalytic subunit
VPLDGGGDEGIDAAMRTRRLELLHWVNAATFALAGLTGLLLYLRAFSAGLLGGGVLWLRDVHIASGIVALVLWPSAGVLAGRDLAGYLRRTWTRTANAVWIAGAAVVWTVSGLLVAGWDRVPDGTRATGLFVHDALSLTVVGWALVHAGSRLLGWRWRWWQKAAPEVGQALSRRDFLRYASAFAFGCLLSGGWRRLANGDRVPPIAVAAAGERGYFRVYRVTDYTPVFDPSSWVLRVEGLVERPQKLTWSDLQALPPRTLMADFHCVSGWVVRNVRWTGVPLAAVAARAGVLPGARFVTFRSADRVYSDSFTIEQALAPQVLLAYRLEGQPLVAAQGAPLRVVNPRMYGYKGVKWVERIVFTDRREMGYWERRGYDVDGYVV